MTPGKEKKPLYNQNFIWNAIFIHGVHPKLKVRSYMPWILAT